VKRPEIGMLPKLLAISVATMLAGCSTATYKTVVAYSDLPEMLVGTLEHNFMQGSASFNVKSEKSGIVCEGIGERPYFVPSNWVCEGQRGRGFATCTDGRKFQFEWLAQSCFRVVGSGKDSRGNVFRLIADIDKDTAAMKDDISSVPLLSAP
jgi:hypothetical protein